MNSLASKRQLRSPPDKTLTKLRARGREKKIPEITDHMLGATVDEHGVAVVAEVLLHRLLLVELIAQLIQIDRFKPSAQMDLPLLRTQFTDQQA